jgi:hypothetical protein
VNSKKLLCIACLFLLVFGVAATLWAQSATYNRPNPLMDYTIQELGVYDTSYTNLDENSCRACHGNSTADRHHGTVQVVRDHLCATCHPTCTPGTTDCENGITLHRDCTTSNCHSWNDVKFGNGKWHHTTDLSGAENCTACHDPNLIGEITPFRDFSTYPPSVVTPTPFSCENCHWEQDVVAGTIPPDGNTPGHPSTYTHKDPWGYSVGFYEYGKPILNNIDTHHMEFQGNVATQCYKCHSTDPDLPSWDPYNPELIRYCEICHSVLTLHYLPVAEYGSNHPHVDEAGQPGWTAIGFHAGGGGSTPMTWQKAGSIDYTPQVNPKFTQNQMCWGCHGDDVPPYVEPTSCSPFINADAPGTPNTGLMPTAGSCGVIGQLRGGCFGEEHIAGTAVQIAPKVGSSCDWSSGQDLPINAWTDDYIEWELPCWAYAPGNYCIRVKGEAGNSNRVIFTVKDHPSLTGISPLSGPCTTQITLTGPGGYDTHRNKMFDAYFGVSHVVVFDASAGEYTATSFGTPWTDSAIKVNFKNLFEDQVDTCSIDPLTQQPRGEGNFVRDNGASNDCTTTPTCLDEPLLTQCTDMALGDYSVYVKAVYFGDDDTSGGLSCGDTIYQVETSDPVTFTLTNDPYIYKLNPKQIVDDNQPPLELVKVYGGNFGTAQNAGDSVRIGTKAQANSATLGLGKEMSKIKIWSNLLIKARFNAPNTWQGKTKYVWVEKAGMKSNAKKLAILAP